MLASVHRSKWLGVLMGLGLMWLFFFPPAEALAHKTYLLQSLIDEKNLKYQLTVVEDDEGATGKETNHLFMKFGDFSHVTESIIPYEGEEFKKHPQVESTAVTVVKSAPFAFAPVEIKGIWLTAKNHATKEDIDRAYWIGEMLGVNMNEALYLINDGKPYKDVEEMMKATKQLYEMVENGVTYNGYSAVKGMTEGKPSEGLTSSDYVTITKNKGETDEYSSAFVYRMPKGYQQSGISKYADDVPYLNWGMLFYQANYNYAVDGFSVQNQDEISSLNPFEQMIVDATEHGLQELRYALGLYEINELVFNDGVRSSSGFYYGIMKKEWSNVAITFYWFFLFISWTFVGLALAKILLQQSAAAINPMLRVSLKADIARLIISAMLLGASLPLMTVVFSLNARVIAVIASLLGDSSANLSTMANYSTTIGGVILQIFYFFIALALNFLYIMRAIILAILIGTAPLFIMGMMFGATGTELFKNWLKELIANLLLQPIHALMLVFFFSFTATGRGIENAVIMFSLLPLTEMFRTMITGQSGKFTSDMGGKLTAGAVGAVGAVTAGVLAGNKREKSQESAYQEKNGGSGKGDTALNEKDLSIAGKSSKIQTASNQTSEHLGGEANLGISAFGGGEGVAKVKATDNENFTMQSEPTNIRERSLNPSVKQDSLVGNNGGTYEPLGVKGNAKSSTFEPNNGGTFVSDVPRKMNTKGGLVRAGAGIAKVGLGVGMGLALGGTGNGMDKVAVGLTGTGVMNAKHGSTDVYQRGKEIYGAQKEYRKEGELPSSYVERASDGNLKVHHNQQALQQRGVMNPRMESADGQDVLKVNYHPPALNQEHQEYFAPIKQAYESGDQEQIAHYRSQGIEDFRVNDDGQYLVSYNQQGRENIGVSSMETVGTGPRARVVETKKPTHQDTNLFYPMESYAPPVAPPPSTGPKPPNDPPNPPTGGGGLRQQVEPTGTTTVKQTTSGSTTSSGTATKNSGSTSPRNTTTRSSGSTASRNTTNNSSRSQSVDTAPNSTYRPNTPPAPQSETVKKPDPKPNRKPESTVEYEKEEDTFKRKETPKIKPAREREEERLYEYESESL